MIVVVPLEKLQEIFEAGGAFQRSGQDTYVKG